MFPRRAPAVTSALLLFVAGCSTADSPTSVEGPPAVAEEGGLAGRISWVGELPAREAPQVEPPEACAGVQRGDSVTLGPEGGLAQVLVWVPAAELPEAAASYELRASGCAFEPRVGAAPSGVRLEVVNSDPVIHSFHLRLLEGEEERGLQNLAVPPGTPPLSWEIRRAGLVHVRSDAFDWMHAWIRVGVEGPWTLSDSEGRFSFPELPAGSWDVWMWHPLLGELRETVTVSEDGPASLYRQFGS